MPTNTESLNNELFRLLSKYKPKPLDAEGKATPIPDEADIFKFEFTKDGEDYGTVYVTLDEDRVLTVYFGDDVTESPSDKTPGLDYDDTWSGLLHQLSAWRMTKGLRGFKTQNKDRVSDDMARRNHMRKKDKIAEGYYPMGKKASYNDSVPSVKIVIEHSRVIEEGEQRYRNINRIFLENQLGERYLLDTKKPGIARVYARHIAEGGKVNDDRWNHIGSLCEEYNKMAGFVRATRNGQFNESAQQLVNEGLLHYQSLRESLSRLTGKRGYNAYFENWTPSLMEDNVEENNLNELFVQETLDPRIESVMPILNRIHKKVSESTIDKELNKLAEWADSLSEAEGESLTSNNPIGIPEDEEVEDQLDELSDKKLIDYQKKAEKEIASGQNIAKRSSGLLRTSHSARRSRGLDPYADTSNLKNYPLGEEGVAEGYEDNPVVNAVTRRILMQRSDLLQKYGPEAVTNAIENIADFVGDVEEIGSSDVSGWVRQVERELGSMDNVAEDLDANQKRVGQLGPTEKVKNNNIGKLVGANESIEEGTYNKDVERAFPSGKASGVKTGASAPKGTSTMPKDKEKAKGKPAGKVDENFINSTSQAVTTEEDEIAEGILDNIKNMFKPKDPTPVSPITADDIAKGYQTQPEFKAQVDQIAKQQGISPQELIKQLQQQAGGGVAQNASVPTQAFHEGLMDTLKKGVAGVKKFGQDAKAAGKEAWDEVGPMLKQDWKHPIQAAMAKEGEMDEGAYTQHYHDANKFTGDIDHGERPPTDWSVDPIEAGTDRIHQKISNMLKKLSKPENKPLDKEKTSLGSTVLDEMDKSEHSAGRDIEGKPGPDREAKSVSKEKANKDALDVLTNIMDKEHDKKKDVKEGQEDLDAIKRLLGK